MKQCAVLIVNRGRGETSHHQALERIGFRVTETTEWPGDDAIRDVEVVIVLLRHIERATMVAARMRAKPHFGHRVLIAVVGASATVDDRRDAIGSGLDDLISETRDSRLLIARVLRCLRLRPQYRCFLPDRKRSAA